MKVALICYHANIKRLYKPAWVEQYWSSILRQTYNDFKIYEMCYSGEKDRIFEHSIYESEKMPTFIDAMNHLIEKALTDGADVVCNTNADDVYYQDWLKTELPYIEAGFDIVSCNFALLHEDRPMQFHVFDKLDVKKELERGNNIIAHPAVLYSRKFLQNNKYVPTEIPAEDMLLWRRTIDDYKFKIVPDNLLFHRVHENAVCRSENR